MSPRPTLIGLCLAALALAGSSAGMAARAVHRGSVESATARRSAPSPLPLAFEPNRGQAPEDVRYMARVGGGRLLVRDGSLALRVRGEEFGLNLVGAKTAAPKAETRAPGVVNYLVGRDPSKWRTGVPLYETVRLSEVYPGIDLVVHGRSGKMEYDFEVAPGADPSRVALRLTGGSPQLERNGDMVIKSRTAEVRHVAPVVYQMNNGRREPVKGAFRLASAGAVSFELGEYDRSRPLIIDPVLLLSTYFGGTSDDTVQDVVTDAAGGVFVVGTTFSDDFPVHGGGDRNLNGGTDAFVARFRNRGGALDYCTFLGGTDDESGFAIDLGLDGEVCVAGLTRSNNFPTRNAAFPDFRGGFEDAFVARLNAAGDNLLFSTYFGGGDSDVATGLAVGPQQDVFITGRTTSLDLPGVNGSAQEEIAGITDAFVARLDHDGENFDYITYLGGSNAENSAASGGHIAVDADGNAYVTGTTFSPDFPTTRDAFQREGGDDHDVFVTRVNPEGTRFDYSTFLGGNLNDYGTGIAVDSDGGAVVTGATSSLNFPTTARAVQREFAGGQFDAFVTRLQPGGARLDFSTFLGGTRDDASIVTLTDGAGDVALDAGGNVYVTGSTESEDFPKKSAAQKRPGGNFDSFLTVLTETGGTLLSSTLLGGANSDQGNAVAVDNQLGAWVAGQTQSIDFPVRRAFQTQNPGGFLDGTLSRIGFNFPKGRHLFVSPRRLEFEPVNVGRSRTRRLVIQNRGTRPLAVEVAPLVGGPFEVVSGLGEKTLGAGESFGVVVRFTPTDDGSARTTLHVLSNDRANRDVKVRVTGVGR